MKNITSYPYCLKKHYHLPTDEQGFSFLEMLIALAISGILMGSVYFVLNTFTKTFTSQDVRVITQQAVRSCLDLMVRDIRNVGFDPANRNDVGIVNATGTSLNFTTYKNEDEDLDSLELVDTTYELDGTDLKINGDPLIGNVNAFQFSYFDENGSDLGSAPTQSDIRAIGILLTVNEPAGRAGVISSTMTTRIVCRNLIFD